MNKQKVYVVVAEYEEHNKETNNIDKEVQIVGVKSDRKEAIAVLRVVKNGWLYDGIDLSVDTEIEIAYHEGDVVAERFYIVERELN